MGLKIKWTIFAKQELRKIYNYYKDNASRKTTEKIVWA